MEKSYTDSIFWQVFNKIIHITYLSVIWIVFSIPVVTIGASTTALFYVSLKLAENEEGYIFKSFWKSFKQNFKQATIIWLILGVLIAFFCFDLNLLMNVEVPGGSIMKGVYLGALLLTVLVALYVFAVLSRFENTIKNTFLNAAMMAARHLPSTLCMAAIVVTVILASLMGFPPLLLVAPGIIGFLNSMLLKNIFKKYMPKEEDPDAWTVEEASSKEQ